MSLNLPFYGSTGQASGADGDPEPDPTKWLGGHRASNRVDRYTDTAVVAGSSKLFFGNAGGFTTGDFNGNWLVFLNGPAEGLPAKIQNHVVSGPFSAIRFDRDIGVAPLVGNTYAVFRPNAVLPLATAQQCEEGHTNYRCIFMNNETGGALSGVRYHLVPLDVPLDRIRRMSQITNTVGDVYVINSETESPTTNGNQGQAPGFNATDGLQRPIARDQVVQEDASWPDATKHGIFLERALPAGTRARASVGFMLVGTASGGEAGYAIILWDQEGADATLDVSIDRGFFQGFSENTKVSTFGGTRILATATGAIKGEPFPDLDVQFAIGASDPGSISPTDVVTDASGLAQSAYAAPETNAEDGTLVTLTARVVEGVEVPNPFSV